MFTPEKLRITVCKNDTDDMIFVPLSPQEVSYMANICGCLAVTDKEIKEERPFFFMDLSSKLRDAYIEWCRRRGKDPVLQMPFDVNGADVEED